MPNEDVSARTVDVLDRTTAFQGYFRVDRYALRHSQFNGGMGPTVQREVFERGHAAAVIPYDAVRDTVVLIEQFRPGAYAQGARNPWLIEIVAGIIDPGETPEGVCRREAVEEAGLQLGRMERLSTQFMSPGASSETVALYVAEVDSNNAGGVHGLAEEGEDIRVFVEPFETVLAMVLDNRIRNAMTTIPILLLAHARDRLRSDWT